MLQLSQSCADCYRNSEDVQLSRSLSWLLRHGAVKEGFDLSPEGYIDVDKILGHKSFKQNSCSDIERVVRNNEKQRFQLRVNPGTGALQIKAHQGHSIHTLTDAGLTPILTAKYPIVVHGTYTSCWAQIKQSGLSRMRRRHIHLAKGLPSDRSVVSGLRTSAQIHIYINLTRALEDGIKFYESDNGVILTPGNDNGFLETKYFDKVVEVSTGYPPYTKPQDLAHAFCKFGSVRLNHDWVTDGAACLEFTHPDHARAAIRASRSVNVYGAFLTVTACSARTRPRVREPPPPHRQRRAPGPNFKGTIVEPASIPLQGAFHQQLDALLAAVRLTQPEIERLAQLYRDLECVLGELWPGCRAIPFGSVTTGLGVKSSDADCFVSLPPGAGGGGGGAGAGEQAVARAKRALQAHPRTFAELLAIPRANTPIVKFLHLPTRVYCDVSFKTPLGSMNSKLIAFLLFSDPRLIPVAVAVKYWARVHDLTGTGKLTNYALTMMIIFYFQQPPVSILPAVEWLQRERAYDCEVDGWNTGFMSDLRRVPRPEDASSIADLLGGFFEYYADFDFEQSVVCPFLGRTLKKDDFRDLSLLPDEFARYKRNVSGGAALPMRFMTPMCVQDPFEQCHNVASSVASRLAADIRAYFKFAAEAYRREKLKDYSGFLPTILLEKPDLPRAKKGSSSFRARLPPSLIQNIVAADWKAAVRHVAFQVFETILRVRLDKIEDKSDQRQPGKEEKRGETGKGKISKRKDVPAGAPEEEKVAISGETDKHEKKSEDSFIPRQETSKSKESKKIRKDSEEAVKCVKETDKHEQTVVAPTATDNSGETNSYKRKGISNPERKAKVSSDSKEKPKIEIINHGRGGITRREKERYTGEITRAIWKRKMFSKLYSVMGLKFLDRETMITDEIMKVDNTVLDVKFEVLVTFVNAPRFAAVSVRHLSGDLNAFKELGKFFNKTFQHWFVILYKPHCRKPVPNAVAENKVAAVTDEEAAAKELHEAMQGDRDLDNSDDSDSDSEFSYEDERVDPNEGRSNSEDVVESIESTNVRDADKNSKNKSNSAVKKQSESEKKNNSKDNKDQTDKIHNEDEINPSEKSPRKRKNKLQRADKNKDPPIDHLNDEVEALNIADKPPRNNKNYARTHDKNTHEQIVVDDQTEGDESRNKSDKWTQNKNRTQHGDYNGTCQQIAKSKSPRHRHRKARDKPQGAPAPASAEARLQATRSAGENAQMP